jgi:hypothetical protein
LLPGVTSGFAASSGFLFATKSTSNLSTGSANVAVDNAAITSLGTNPLEHVLQVLGKESRRETLGHSVVHLDGLVESLELHYVHDRGKNLVLYYRGVVANFNNGGHHIVALSRDHFSAAENLSSLALNCFETLSVGF